MKKIVCLMGPTASGKTALAVDIVQRFPYEIISVDSAMVYRGMDIGTAKPGLEILQIAPHRLIDFLDPKEPYSAGEFRADALREIEDVLAHGKIPLLVGGTMLYFKILQQGLAKLPKANAEVRAALQTRAEQIGWDGLHAVLAQMDPVAAARISSQDSQRIQRALEVYELTGRTISAWQAEETQYLSPYQFYTLGLMPSQRERLHERIAIRFDLMLKLGLVEEVKRLYTRDDLSSDLPAIRSVGYRQVWRYLANEIDYETMRTTAITATRQLAKRQMTWLRSWPEVKLLDADAPNILQVTLDTLKQLSLLC